MEVEAKAEEIDACLSSPNVDLWRLREFALSDGGFLNSKSIFYKAHLVLEQTYQNLMPFICMH